MSYEAGVSLCPGETWGTQGQTLFPNLQSCVRPAGVVSPYRALDRNQGQKISPGYKNKSVHEGLGRIVTTKTRLLQFVMLPWGKGFTLASSLRPSSCNLLQQLPARSFSQEGPHRAQVLISLSFAHQVFPKLIKLYLCYCAHPTITPPPPDCRLSRGPGKVVVSNVPTSSRQNPPQTRSTCPPHYLHP